LGQRLASLDRETAEDAAVVAKLVKLVFASVQSYPQNEVSSCHHISVDQPVVERHPPPSC
jgi:hypothetical protein